jgi:hypothetical protein
MMMNRPQSDSVKVVRSYLRLQSHTLDFLYLHVDLMYTAYRIIHNVRLDITLQLIAFSPSDIMASLEPAFAGAIWAHTSFPQ